MNFISLEQILQTQTNLRTPSETTTNINLKVNFITFSTLSNAIHNNLQFTKQHNYIDTDRRKLLLDIVKLQHDVLPTDRFAIEYNESAFYLRKMPIIDRNAKREEKERPALLPVANSGLVCSLIKKYVELSKNEILNFHRCLVSSLNEHSQKNQIRRIDDIVYDSRTYFRMLLAINPDFGVLEHVNAIDYLCYKVDFSLSNVMVILPCISDLVSSYRSRIAAKKLTSFQYLSLRGMNMITAEIFPKVNNASINLTYVLPYATRRSDNNDDLALLLDNLNTNEPILSYDHSDLTGVPAFKDGESSDEEENMLVTASVNRNKSVKDNSVSDAHVTH